jgi:hypothetical protein
MASPDGLVGRQLYQRFQEALSRVRGNRHARRFALMEVEERDGILKACMNELSAEKRITS